ncbi:hypothetical protein Indivirus_6_3 [Indivirus ILV1]|uniref:Uncharacterized protein n=1 Tax=Indivirus ILV1 TaxID=1977633 RepID=A0A1V0SDZ6_9VIRU|nr:hypothetical protein Indivirus_6_3 [Indivirus ILV1]
MNNEINLETELLLYSIKLHHSIEIQGTKLDFDLNAYNDMNIIDELNKWQSCFGILGKGNMYESKYISKIIYCLVSDAHVLNNINNIDLFNPILNRFLQIESLTKNNRKIHLRVFPICKTLIVIDWKQYPIYKVYEIHNIDQVKKYYKCNKIEFDTFIKDIRLHPILSSDISNLKDNFKILSITRFQATQENHIKLLEIFLSNHKILEKEIQKEYKKIIKKPSTKAYFV